MLLLPAGNCHLSMKKLLNVLLNPLGLEVVREKITEFEIAGIHYSVDGCSVGLTPQGERTGLGAVRLIQERGFKQLKILDICCGVGIVGLTIYAKLHQTDHVSMVAFADINIFNINSLKRTLSINGLETEIGSKFLYWLSDGLKSVPENVKFDLIVSNPPHFLIPDFKKNDFSPGRLGGFDPQWSFHRDFYQACDRHLSERGEVWFLENSEGAQESDLLPFITANKALRYVRRIDEPLLPGFFWMITQRV